MSTHSTDGRPWAKLSELKPGDKLVCDGGFTCMRKGQIGEVSLKSEGPLFHNEFSIPCDKGKHFLSGQLSGIDLDSLVGLWRA